MYLVTFRINGARNSDYFGNLIAAVIFAQRVTLAGHGVTITYVRGA